MNQKYIRLFSLVLAFALIVSAIPFFSTQAAAASWPSFSASAYCEVIAPRRINVYRNSSLTIRGSSSPAKSYNSYIDPGDICKIYRINGSSAEVGYPTSSGYKMGYIHTAELIGCTSPSEQVTSRGKATTYRSPGGSSIGYVASGDAVFKLFTSGSYTAIIYSAKNSSGRAYKFGYVSSSDYSRTISQSTANSVKYTVKTVTYNCSSLDAWINSVLKQEGKLNGVVLSQTVISWKTIAVKVPTGPSYNGKSSCRTDKLRLPYQVTYRLHTHERKMGYGQNFRYQNGCIVTMYSCECGYTRDLVSWEIPLPDSSEAQTTRSVINRLPQNNK